MRRIGIDVGGTNTDAVLVEEGRVVAAVKAPTTEDVTSGVLDALERLGRATDLSARRIDAVMIGTTHFINAVVQRRDLSRVGALRISLPASASLPPFCDWPEDLAETVRGGVWMVEGGHEYDGRPFMPLDRDAVRRAAREMKEAGLRAVAISAAFSPIDASHEREAAAILRDEHPEAVVTCSADLGRIGLLERENVALMNAALTDLAALTIEAMRRALDRSGVGGRLYITQNDGTVAEAEQAARLPVYAFASGATNSMRGAAYLSGVQDAMVLDVGGTTTDIGELRKGFPREANAVVEVGGVRTLFRMPDVLSIGLGGGSLVEGDTPTVGPRSVGWRLTREALVFGGRVLTATDAAVRAGRVAIGDAAAVEGVAAAYAAAALGEARRMIEEAVDRMKTEAGDVPVIAVGGGAFLAPERLAGCSDVIHPPHGDCANAVGAAIAQVSGEVDRIFRDLSRAEAIDQARRLATEAAVEAGADPATIQIVDVEDMPLAYLPGASLRVRVRVVGDVAAAA